ncbi:MAG: tRNA (guanosine(46)-N7)-methyltransferase TrmB [Gammaproteobacteria bacterium]|nr:tRNA (guanosine(46)-N7)-methyltransferase TrmB [Gammaproteobacteria bacterium]MXW44822.1 tRNA (guanosine(46)-N7)-methyltransferase TrmB [Gammaproteobacteria bacterium]MYD02051.1 tRNA (guanosine(46)-N7)-methyltransferase TrmB [Gammaproteobacteria bacterium]MYI24018.1 tRNA (guanosine(46)-N7)-methyltransferase TrmB [Gammaproteobacteria bacterium]
MRQKAPPRSFVRRSGRITRAQKRALEELWPAYGLDESADPILLEQVFGRRAPTVLEIGFGNGETLVRSARESPDVNYLGIEVHLPGLGRCMLLAEKAGIRNLRLIQGDAVEVLGQRMPSACLAMVCLYFPDPWPRKRHHKRRLVQPGFVRLIERVLEPRGVFHVATDWAPYAEHIEHVMSGNAAFERLSRPPSRYTTRFETRGSALGHEIWEAAYCVRRER